MPDLTYNDTDGSKITIYDAPREPRRGIALLSTTPDDGKNVAVYLDQKQSAQLAADITELLSKQDRDFEFVVTVSAVDVSAAENTVRNAVAGYPGITNVEQAVK